MAKSVHERWNVDSEMGTIGANVVDEDEDNDQELSLQEGRWITWNGTPVYIDKSGSVIKGPAVLKGLSVPGTSLLDDDATSEAKDKTKKVASPRPRSSSVASTPSTVPKEVDGRPTSTAKNLTPSNKWAQEVSKEEGTAVADYVETGYAKIIRAQMGLSVPDNEKATYQKKVKTLDTALAKAPAFQGSVFRGDSIRRENVGEIKALTTKGVEFTSTRFMSFSASEGKAKGFINEGLSGREHFYIKVISKSAADIRAWNLKEQEVVYRAGTRFRVKSTKLTAMFGRNVHVVNLEEL